VIPHPVLVADSRIASEEVGVHFYGFIDIADIIVADAYLHGWTLLHK
jgi:hypothetical protein